MKYHVVRLDYGIIDSAGNYHVTHRFSTHRKHMAALRAACKMQKKYNCVDIIDSNGKKVEWFHLLPNTDQVIRPV
ncbi:MAG: hypothetical protein KGL39_32280 [Patescibacteria group bacterium]|nr:hypothetical protein [Patescibacteria group bacterium]